MLNDTAAAVNAPVRGSGLLCVAPPPTITGSPLRTRPDVWLAVNDSRPWWLWPNLLALDAPAVAVTWQVFLASVAGVAVPLAAAVVLALVVWGVYLGDRRLDAWRGTGDSDRHRAAARRPVAWSAVAIAALVSAAALAETSLSGAYLRAGCAVAATTAAYLAAVHVARANRLLGRGVKEASVGFVFAAGAAVPLIAGATVPWSWLPSVVAFAALCWLNCSLISQWETAPARALPAWVLVAAACVAVAATPAAPPPVAVAVLTSTVALAGLHALRSRVSVRAARVLADAVMLSPLLVAVWS